ncbi:MAG: hypothetical protein IIB69_14365 [Proteobacteria bacterium]|nr:hypothetical protein [Pseudomonadota bacterium]
MSIEVMSLVWKCYPGGGSKLLTMLALADWAGSDGSRIYPSMATLAAKIRMSERQVTRIVRELTTERWRPDAEPFLEHLNPKNKGGRKTTNRYQINRKTLSDCHRLGSETLTNDTLNPDISNGNPDIAMSADTLEPLEPLTVPATDAARTWKPDEDREATLTRYLDSLKTLPVDPRELKRARQELTDFQDEKKKAGGIVGRI